MLLELLYFENTSEVDLSLRREQVYPHFVSHFLSFQTIKSLLPLHLVFRVEEVGVLSSPVLAELHVAVEVDGSIGNRLSFREDEHVVSELINPLDRVGRHHDALATCFGNLDDLVEELLLFEGEKSEGLVENEQVSAVRE